ncbi:MAG: MltA domain-containing protein [Thermodesulfobacteriota bacterium]|nr:MltA domain-containing protein [Thermodesulfobacteriota bacterium]
MQMRRVRLIVLALTLSFLFLISLGGCAKKREIEIKRPEDTLVLFKGWWKPKFVDDLDKESLKVSVDKSISYLKRFPLDTEITYGPHTYSAGHLIRSMELFLDIFSHSLTPKELNKKIRRNFHIYKSVGADGSGSVLFTGYYEPILKGSLIRTDQYRFPLYMRPKDLMVIDLGQFHSRFEGERIVARYDNEKVIPFYNRKEIDIDNALEGRGLELLWVDDHIDRFFLQIQGSGVIVFDDGSVQRVHYAGSNGRPYRSVGKVLIRENKISRAQTSLQGVKAYLKGNPQEMDRILNHNESYVFFEKVERGPIGNINLVLTPERSIATDYRLFPKGGLAFIISKKPVIDPTGSITKWKKFSRFVMNQDTGGAIRGPGRVDFFWGGGRYAEIAAGSMYQYGELYFLVSKK